MAVRKSGGVKGVDRTPSASKELVLNSPDMLLKQQQRMAQFTQQKASTLQSEQKLKTGIKFFGLIIFNELIMQEKIFILVRLLIFSP